MTPASIAAAATSFIGVPFVWQQADEHGMDCHGLIVAALLKAGYTPRHPETFFYASYDDSSDDAYLLDGIAYEAVQIEVEAIQPGDILLFKWPRQMYPQHCGIVSRVMDGVPYIVHSLRRPTNCVVENRLADEWRARLHSAWRLRCLTEVNDGTLG